LIGFCIKLGVGTLILFSQEEKTAIAKEEKFVLRNWSVDTLIFKTGFLNRFRLLKCEI
jgi:hypothetical protein